MGNIMSLLKVSNKASRNGFSLSQRNAFTAKIGELLPVFTKECIPGDVFEYNPSWFTRTQPVNTAAYTRIKEYVDVFFVPTNLLWNQFNTWVTQMSNNSQQASSITENATLPEQQPYILGDDIIQYLENMASYEGSQQNPLAVDVCGFSRCAQAQKLLEYLGYGYFIGQSNGANPALSPWPLLAYQKIYADYYRDQQWENADATTFNVNYVTYSGDSEIPIGSLAENVDSIFTLRYANWKKDYFMGLLPNSQYGDVSVAPLNEGILRGAGNVSTGTSGNGAIDITVSNETTAGVSILALRRAEAFQKWKEITQSNQQDYKHQVLAHFGENVSDAYSDHVTLIKAFDSVLDIGEVVNSNLNTGDTSSIAENQASIAGKGVGSGSGHLRFKAPCHGVFMAIYHAVPLLDYAISGFDPFVLKTLPTDYAIPEFDKTGMVSIPLFQLINPYGQFSPSAADKLAYAPQYIDYKTSYDVIRGGFIHGGLNAWVSPMTTDYFISLMSNSAGYYTGMTYATLKVNPTICDTIFAVDANPGANNTDDFPTQYQKVVATDQLLINFLSDCTAVRNLDRNGLPY